MLSGFVLCRGLCALQCAKNSIWKRLFFRNCNGFSFVLPFINCIFLDVYSFYTIIGTSK